MRWWWILAVAGCQVTERSSLGNTVVAGGTGAVIERDEGTVTLSEATVTFSDLRLEEPSSMAWSWSPIQAAYAHPGHDYPGDVAGELLGTWTVDLVGPDTELGVAACYTGDYATGRVTLAGTAAVFAGTYSDTADREFRFEVPADQDIIGIPFDLRMDDPGTVVLRFDPARALSYVDWTADDTDEDGVLTLADDAFPNPTVFGVVATPSWSLAYEVQ